MLLVQNHNDSVDLAIN